jgi:hypothetical protein
VLVDVEAQDHIESLDILAPKLEISGWNWFSRPTMWKYLGSGLAIPGLLTNAPLLRGHGRPPRPGIPTSLLHHPSLAHSFNAYLYPT